MTPRQIASALGRRGGRARAQRLTKDQRRRIASLGGHARRESVAAANRIIASLRHARMVALMQRRRDAVRRVKTFGGPLPGLYRDRPADDRR